MCQRCKSSRVFSVSGKCSDMCSITDSSGKKLVDGDYVPYGVLGGGDYINFSVCGECGQVQGGFPVSDSEFMRSE